MDLFRLLAIALVGFLTMVAVVALSLTLGRDRLVPDGVITIVVALAATAFAARATARAFDRQAPRAAGGPATPDEQAKHLLRRKRLGLSAMICFTGLGIFWREIAHDPRGIAMFGLALVASFANSTCARCGRVGRIITPAFVCGHCGTRFDEPTAS